MAFHGKRRDDDRYAFKIECFNCSKKYAQSRKICPNCKAENVDYEKLDGEDLWVMWNNPDRDII
jgi:uncharacterized OB-fold protein